MYGISGTDDHAVEHMEVYADIHGELATRRQPLQTTESPAEKEIAAHVN